MCKCEKNQFEVSDRKKKYLLNFLKFELGLLV